MTQKLSIGQITKGLNTTLQPWNIDNDAFPTLVNAYQWRGNAKRKRGTLPLTRLQRNLTLVSLGNISAGGAGDVTLNIFSLLSLQSTASIVPGNLINITITIGAPISQTLTNTNGSSTLAISPAGIIDAASINYATGIVTIHFTGVAGSSAVTFTGGYYPGLPVLEVADLVLAQQIYPGTLAFDTRYSYNVLTNFPFTAYDVSFYKNPTSGVINGITYTAKTTPTSLTWNGQDYQQYWSVSDENALWVTNQFDVPFTGTSIGMQFAGNSTSSSAQKITYISNDSVTLTVSITNCPLVIGDWVFVNEWTGTNASTLNFQTGFVTASSNPGGTSTVVIKFPFANIGAGPYVPGIIQYLTNRCDATKDCLRWYDGDPTNGTITSFSGGLGWVNFTPPLSQLTFPSGGGTLGDLPPAQYYLVGAALIWPFKDRIIFLGAVVQSSTRGPFYLQDTVVYSWNGTPYYTASFDGTHSVVAADTQYFPLLVPGVDAYAISTTNIPTTQTASPNAYFEDVAGFGGNISAGIQQPITSVAPNQDVLIVGFPNRQTKIVYTSDDILPFLFYQINSELGTVNAFSAIILDRGILSIGSRGIVQSDQVSVSRIDMDILDQVFQFNLLNNGTQRTTAQRDFINEWCYFTYRSNKWAISLFPNQTLFYNYRDQSWAIFDESFTCYGQFRKQSARSWNQYTDITWLEWNDPWIAGLGNTSQPLVVGGNQQGFILVRDTNTGEAPSLFIQSFSASVVTSPNHGLNNGDYIIIDGALGTISSQVNGKVFSVGSVTANTFVLNPLITSGTYFGGAVITRMYIPQIYSKQFPAAWGLSRKTRIGPQQYLFTTTVAPAQVSLLIFLSTSGIPSNQGVLFPDDDVYNSSLIYTQVLYTCPETTDLGLAPASITPQNINLQQLVPNQLATWHRMNTSLLGDTVQFGFTLSDEQMRALSPKGIALVITAATNANPAILTVTNGFAVGQIILVQNILGMTQLNNNYYQVIARTPTTITIDVNSTAFGVYISGGSVTPVGTVIQFSEIEFLGAILDISPSGMLS